MAFMDGGLGDKAKARYRKRRKALAKTVGMPYVIYGLDQGPGGGNPWDSHVPVIYQDPELLYLTGVNQLNTALLVDPITGADILFLAPHDAKKEFWEGKQLGVGTKAIEKLSKEITGFKDIRYIDDLNEAILEVLKASKKRSIGTFWHEATQGKKRVAQDSNYRFKKQLERLLAKERPSTKVVNIAPQAWDQRLVLDKEDIEDMREANHLTGYCFQDVLVAKKSLKTETDVAGYLNGQLQMRSPFGQSFPSIVAGGKNACVLHYTKNNDPLPKKGLLLLDFGLRWNHMHADISRTIPVSGIYSPLQRVLMDIVLKTQKAVQKATKPGATLDSLNTLAWDTLNGLLEKKVLAKGGLAKLEYETAPHRIGHLIGYQVHEGDPFRNYNDVALKPGMVISNEPGLYGYFELTINRHRYKEWIGIRIEDDLLITGRGCENLSIDIPKTPDEIELLMAALV